MYTYSAGSQGTFGCETQPSLAGGPAVYMRGPGFGCPGIMQRGGMLGLGAETAGGGWADVIAATVGGLATVYSLSTQQKMATQTRHQAERDAALAAEQAKTQALYLKSGSVTPGLSAQVPSEGMGWGGRLALMGGVAAVGVGVLWAMRRGRRRR